MNVFVLSTGRCGSTTFAKACGYIENYSTAHESQAQVIGFNRLSYPQSHIEVDNRLSWMLGSLDQRYGNDAFYVHLKRDRLSTASSFLKRWDVTYSIIRHYAEGILMLEKEECLQGGNMDCCLDYYDKVNDNIAFFLKDKANKMNIDLETWEDTFPIFWQRIGALGNLDAALSTLASINNSWVEEQLNKQQQRKPSVYKRIWKRLKPST